MSFLKKTKLRLGEYLLKKQSRGISRELKAINLKQAKSVGVIFDAGQKEDRKIISDFLRPLADRGAKYSILGFIPDIKDQNDYISDKTYTFFSIKECDWLYRPTTKEVDHFINQKFDILLFFAVKDYFPLKWVLRLSKAKFKAGAEGYYHEDLDFMINTDITSTAQLLKEIEHYLGNLQVAENQMA
ncbi:DUF6913 domain-containing protein [Geofilum sp. OHC36d9]|uniref:DUF6913 domain-containing protein n=1 Tax=Geofilum sp. OHC36d9 TaxID=3458413 RepID=UPI004033ADFD